MSTINIFQICFEIWGCVISIFVCLLLGGISLNGRDKVARCLWVMLLVNVLLLTCDALAYIYRGDQTLIGLCMTHISNFGLFALEIVLLALFAWFVRELTGGGALLHAWWERIAYLFLAVGLACLVATQFTGLYYSFDSTNHYQRGSGIWISFATCGAAVLACVYRLWAGRARIGRHDLTTLALCLVVFAACIMLQFVFYGLSLINVAITISLLLLYLRRLKAQYDKLLEKRVEEAVRDTRALCMWKQTGERLGQPEGRERGEEHQE